VLAWVSDENTSCGAWTEFVLSGGIEVGIAEAAKGAETDVGWMLAKEKKMGRLMVDVTARMNVKEKGGGVECFDPKTWW
jgi:hypothetical protein